MKPFAVLSFILVERAGFEPATHSLEGNAPNNHPTSSAGFSGLAGSYKVVLK